jgi:glycosyltransferase involved in cell wall biosynthesis
LAERVHTLLKNPDLRARLGENATRHAQQYSWANIAEQIAAIYDAELGATAHAACACG